MEDRSDFFNLYRHGFTRVAVCIPEVKVADPGFNVGKTIELVHKAAKREAVFALFPELGISAYTNEDLFFQDALLYSVQASIQRLLNATSDIDMVVVVGAPLKVMQRLYNCGIVIQRGKILGIAVKTYIPNYREFYEKRQFSSSRELIVDRIDLCGYQDIPIGDNLIFDVETIPNFSFFIELCEDVWATIPPSSYAALAGATVTGNLSASNITLGKDEYRNSLASKQSASCVAAYLYAAAGPGESTTDLAWDGHAVIYENGNLLAASKRFSWEPQVIIGDVDIDRLVQDRMRLTSFGDGIRIYRDKISDFQRIPIKVKIPSGEIPLERQIQRFPYVPSDPNVRDQRCYEVYNIQVQGLAKRLRSAEIENVVIGVSGGLDSTHALIVCARAMDELNLPRSNIKAYTMPGFATSERTYNNAIRLMNALGVEAGEIDIKPSALQMMKDIDHPFAGGENVYDVTFENVQAGDRTSHLFRIANLKNGIVVGTGDLSELALGWCTYGVGDHMSHYSVNASVPKTLIRYIIRWIVDKDLLGEDVSSCLEDILGTEISPELIPGTVDGQPAHKSEDIIGPFELQDFNNFYITRYGYTPSKVAFLSWCAWKDKGKGVWPDVPEDRRHEYSIAEIKHWLKIYLHRFFRLSQFKRSCIPNAPKVGSGGSLSPRGDYRAPSDSEDAPWMEDLSRIPDKD
ncbi:MAG: NAD(+) synthase [Thermodesulfobacteriota bacterium]|nr:NAD(+) synthase [Thermodesulfobacteriota bacterium]